MVRHSVIFKLKHAIGSSGEKEFLDAAMKLTSLPGVKNFECVKQTSKKNIYDYGLLMEVDTVKAYKEYNQHPDHIAFVQIIG